MPARNLKRVGLFLFACPVLRMCALIFLLLPSTLVVAETASSVLVVTNLGRVLRVFSEGKIEAISIASLSPERPSEELGQGTTGPVPSPDQRSVAFTREHDLWVINLDTRDQTRATTVGKPYTNTHAPVFVYITDWSWDSRQVLYSVAHAETEDPEGETPTLKVWPVNYGFYIYDLEKKTSRAVRIPSEFLAWLPDGDFLVASHTHLPKEQELLRIKSGETTSKPVTSIRGWVSQINVSTDGQWALTSIGQGSSSSTSQILKLDLVNGSITSVSPRGKWAEYQWPQFSPSATHFSYVWQQGLDAASRLPKGMLVVDGQPIYSHVGYLNHRWIDEQSLAIWQTGSPIVLDNKTLKFKEAVTVLDSKTGKVKGQRVFQ